MSTIIGRLTQLIDHNENPEWGFVEFALCGYGSHIPRTDSNLGQFGSPTQATQVDEFSGGFTIELAGNDVIDPPGTFYTYTVKNNNGDIVQCVAYQFLDAQDYDLDWGTTPFDPNQPPPPILQPVLNMLLVVPYSYSADFPGDTYTSWQITLTGDCVPTFSNLVDGNLYTVIIIQDANGEHIFQWPSNALNATPVNPDPNSMTVQTFVAVSGELYPIGAGTYYP